MDSLLLAWGFLLQHPASPWLAPLPWHMPALLFLLGLLAAVGLHHLLGTTYGFYRVGERASPLLALPTLIVLTVSVQVLLAGYLLVATAPQMVHTALAAADARAASPPIGKMLLAPAYARQESGSGQQPADKAALRAALLAYSAQELTEGFSSQLQAVASAKNGAAVENAQGDRGGQPFAKELLLLALHWAAEGYRIRAPVLSEDPHVAGKSGGGANDEAAQDDDGADVPLLSRYILSFVEEIGPGAGLTREDWEHVAGSRFVQRVLEPLLLWKVRHLAAVLVALVVALNLGAFFLLIQLRRGLRRLHASRAMVS